VDPGSVPVVRVYDKNVLTRRTMMKDSNVGGRVPAEGSAKDKASRPGSIDMHTHWEPEAYHKALARLRLVGGGGSPDPLSFDLDKRRKWMDEHGVKMHVLTLSGSMPWQWVPQDVGATLARIINDANIEAHKAFPTALSAGWRSPSGARIWP
jgi:hypothetical protein